MYSKGPQTFIVILLGVTMPSRAELSPSPQASGSDSGLNPTGIKRTDDQEARSSTPCSDSLKEGELMEVKEFFHKLDTNGDNVIDIHEVDAGMRSYGQIMTQDQLEDMINHYDKDGSTKDGKKVIDWEDFCCFAIPFIRQEKESSLPNGERGTVKKEFSMFESANAQHGLVESAQSKASSSTSCKDSLKEGELEEVKEAFVMYDANSDQVIDMHELKALWRSMGVEVTKKELQDTMNRCDKDGTTKDGKKVMDLEGFCCFAIPFIHREKESAMSVPLLI